MEFSALLSIYKNEEPIYFYKCMESLYMQSLQASEIVLVIDGPVPLSIWNVIHHWKEKLNINVFPLEKNVGLGEALNYGLSKCKFDLVARMDTDDICDKYRFEKQVSLFKEDNKLTICGSCIDEIEPYTCALLSKRIVPLTHELILKKVAYRNPFNHMTVMYKKSAVLKVGSYQHLSGMEDWYLWLRLLSSGYKAQNIPESLVAARTGTQMLSRRSGFQYVKSEWIITKKKLDLKIINLPKALFIFVVRSVPRLLPTKLLNKVYSYSRGIK